jgi:hypothetical protein
MIRSTSNGVGFKVEGIRCFKQKILYIGDSIRIEATSP